MGWLRGALSTDRPVALFLHQPICLADPEVPDAGDWSVPFPQRRGLLDAMAERLVRVVASGHLHRYRSGSLPDGTPTVWAPAASFTGTIRDDGSTYVVGAVEHVLAPDGTAIHRLVPPPVSSSLHFGPGAEGTAYDAPPCALPMAPPQPRRRWTGERAERPMAPVFAGALAHWCPRTTIAWTRGLDPMVHQ